MNKFAFLIHPRETLDISRRFQVTRSIPYPLINFVTQKLWGRSGFTVCSKEIKFARGEKDACGYIVAVLLNGRQMMSLPIPRVRRRILDAVLYAQNNLGVDVVGLGSLTTSVTDGGAWLVNHPEVKVAITHGDTFTVIIAQEGIERILKRYGINSTKNKIAIVGAYGIIGRELSVFLGRNNFQLILVESVLEKVELIKKRMTEEGLISSVFIASTDISTVSDADFVITATSHHSCLLNSEHLKKNVIVYDIAQPINLSPLVIKQRPDIVRIDGDYVDIGTIDLKFLMGPPQGSTFACLVETAMMAMEDDRRNHVGKIDQKFLEEVRYWKEKYKFYHAPLTSFGKRTK